MLYFVILHVKNVLGQPLTVADPSVPVILPLTLALTDSGNHIMRTAAKKLENIIR